MVPKVRGEIVYGTYPVPEALKANRRSIYKLFAKASVLGRAKQDDIIAKKILRLANDSGVDIKTLNADQLDVLTEYQLHNVCPIVLKEISNQKCHYHVQDYDVCRN